MEYASENFRARELAVQSTMAPPPLEDDLERRAPALFAPWQHPSLVTVIAPGSAVDSRLLGARNSRCKFRRIRVVEFGRF